VGKKPEREETVTKNLINLIKNVFSLIFSLLLFLSDNETMDGQRDNDYQRGSWRFHKQDIDQWIEEKRRVSKDK